jgi:hypothetical protein
LTAIQNGKPLLHGDDHERQVVVERSIAKAGRLASQRLDHFGGAYAHVLVSDTGNIMLAEFDAAGVASFGQAVGVEDKVIARLKLQFDVVVSMIGEET